MPLTAEQRIARAREAVRTRWRKANGRPRKWIGREDERDAQIRELRAKKLTLEEIGNRFGLTRQRVQQILEGRPAA